MAGRGPISEMIGGIPIANTSYSGDLTQMSVERLRARLRELAAADPYDEDCDEAFENRQQEMSTVQQELKSRGKSK